MKSHPFSDDALTDSDMDACRCPQWLSESCKYPCEAGVA